MTRCILALDIGGTFLKSCLCDREGLPLPGTFDRERVDSNGDLAAIKSSYQSLLKRMLEKAESLDMVLSAVAADIPGPFDFSAGISRMEHKYTSLFGVPLFPWFREVLGEVPVRFLHDSSAFLSGASAAHPEIRNCAGVMIGTGLGFAVMKDGSVLETEAGGPAYSIYKMPFRDKTAEDFISARAIPTRYNELSSRKIDSAKTIGDLAESGTDPIAYQVYYEIGENLSEILAPILTELGTEALYLGGQISKSFSVFGPALKEGLKRVSTLHLIEEAKDLDLAHLKGGARWLLTTEPNILAKE